jgi:hypothetical protein
VTITEKEVNTLVVGSTVSVTMPTDEHGNYLIASGVWVGFAYTDFGTGTDNGMVFELKAVGRQMRNIVTGKAEKMEYEDRMRFTLTELEQDFTVFYLCEPAWWQV